MKRILPFFFLAHLAAQQSTPTFQASPADLAAIREKLPTDRRVIVNSCAAVSVGIIEGSVLADLDYSEDVRAEVDLNVVMTGNGEYIEIQGTAEGRTFGQPLLDRQLAIAKRAIARLTELQREALGEKWPLD